MTRPAPNLASPDDGRPVFGYVRVSSDKQDTDRQTQAIPARHAQLPDGLAERELELFSDEGISGYKDVHRPDFAQLSARVEAGEAAALIIDTSSRLTRKGLTDAIPFFLKLWPHRTRLFTTDGREYTPDLTGLIQLAVDAEKDEHYSRDLSHNTKAGQDVVLREGFWRAGPSPSGYDREAVLDVPKPRVTLVPNDAAAAVRTGFEAVARGESINGTAKLIGWNPKTFQKALKKPAYAAFQVDDEGQEWPARWPAIIERATFDKVQAVLERNGHASFQSSNKRQPLGTIARCGLEGCGQTLVLKAERKRPNAYYRCSRGTKVGGHPSAVAEVMEATVIATLIHASTMLDSLIESGEGWKVVTASLDEAGALQDERTAVQAKIEKNAARLSRFEGKPAAEAALERELDALSTLAAELDERVARATRDADTLRAELEQLRDALGLGGAYERADVAEGGRLDQLGRRAARFLDFWSEATVNEKRDTLAAIFERIELHDGFLTLFFRHGLPPVVAKLERDRASADTRALGQLGFGPSRGDDPATAAGKPTSSVGSVETVSA